ncbi:MAG: hypothetical protein KJ958_13110 [Gammaproteobacteria bacterium]|nr:hypothetical protein [Gammaproteobacteria bacterium]MBU1980098.1 hypothetical protein [Gammaproteobacteria bacterium]
MRWTPAFAGVTDLFRASLRLHGFFLQDGRKDLCTNERIVAEKDAIVLSPLSCY